MNETTWLVLGVVCVISTAWTLRGATRGTWSPEMGAIVSFTLMVLWAIFGLQSFAGVKSTTECCTVFEYYPGLGWLGLAFAAGMLMIASKATLAIAEDEQPM